MTYSNISRLRLIVSQGSSKNNQINKQKSIIKVTIFGFFFVYLRTKRQLLDKGEICMEKTNLNRIKAVLAEQNRTGVWLSQQMDKNVATVSRWTSNKVQPSVEQLYEIARILKIDVKDLLVDNEF